MRMNPSPKHKKDKENKNTMRFLTFIDEIWKDPQLSLLEKHCQFHFLLTQTTPFLEYPQLVSKSVEFQDLFLFDFLLKHWFNHVEFQIHLLLHVIQKVSIQQPIRFQMVQAIVNEFSRDSFQYKSLWVECAKHMSSRELAYLCSHSPLTLFQKHAHTPFIKWCRSENVLVFVREGFGSLLQLPIEQYMDCIDQCSSTPSLLMLLDWMAPLFSKSKHTPPSLHPFFRLNDVLRCAGKAASKTDWSLPQVGSFFQQLDELYFTEQTLITYILSKTSSLATLQWAVQQYRAIDLLEVIACNKHLCTFFVKQEPFWYVVGARIRVLSSVATLSCQSFVQAFLRVFDFRQNQENKDILRSLQQTLETIQAPDEVRFWVQTLFFPEEEDTRKRLHGLTQDETQRVSFLKECMCSLSYKTPSLPLGLLKHLGFPSTHILQQWQTFQLPKFLECQLQKKQFPVVDLLFDFLLCLPPTSHSLSLFKQTICASLSKEVLHYFLVFESSFSRTSVPSSTSMECCVCMEQPIQMLFEPCHHVACCEKCAAVVKVCPACRTLIDRTQKVYLAT